MGLLGRVEVLGGAGVLGGGDVEDPRGFGVYLEGVRDSCGDVDERASRRWYGLTALKVERDFSFKNVERLVVLRLRVKRRCRPSWVQLLGKREPPAGLQSGGLDGHEAPEKPERLPLLGAKSVGEWVGVHMVLLPAAQRRRVDSALQALPGGAYLTTIPSDWALHKALGKIFGGRASYLGAVSENFSPGSFVPSVSENPA